MPTYGIRNKKTKEEYEVICSWNELQNILEDEDLEQMLSTPKFVTDSMSTLRRAGSNWQDLLGRIKKGSGKDNNIKL